MMMPAAIARRATRRSRQPGSRRQRVQTTTLKVALPLLFAFAVLGVWQLYVSVGHVSELTLPPPTKIASAFWQDRSTLATNGWITVQEIVLGFLAAIVLGVTLATLIRASRTVERSLYPWLVASQMVPIPAIAPIFVIWTGFDIRPKLMVIALVCFFPIAVNTIDGLRAAEPELLDLLRTLGASRWQRFRAAQLPAALPFVFSGLRISAAFSVLGAVFGEWVGSNGGLGYEILVLNNQNQTTEMFAVIFVLSILGIALFGIISVAERLALPWYYEARRETVQMA